MPNSYMNLRCCNFLCCAQQRSKNCSGPGSAGWFMLMFEGQNMGCRLWHWHSGKEAVCGKNGVETGREAQTIRPCFLPVLCYLFLR